MNTNKAKTISGMMGKGSLDHNRRTFHAKNVDEERSVHNVILFSENIKEIYQELFGEAVERYNAKQKRADRKIPDYYEHIRGGKQEKTFYEAIFQIGNKDDTSAVGEDAELVKEILQKFTMKFKMENPNLRVIGAYIHMDEATPHVHIDFIPFIKDSKRGVDTRVSLKGALEQAGYQGIGKRDNEWNRFVNAQKEILARLMQERGIEWLQKGTKEEHLDVYDFKVKMRKEELATLEVLLDDRTETMERIEQEITESESTLQDIKETKGKLKDLDKIQSQQIPFSNKIKMDKNDLDYLIDCTKRFQIYAKAKIDTKTLSDKIKNLRNQLTKKDGLITTLNAQMENKNAEIENLSAKLEQKESTSAKMQLMRAQQKIEKLETENITIREFCKRNGLLKRLERSLGIQKIQQNQMKHTKNERQV